MIMIQLNDFWKLSGPPQVGFYIFLYNEYQNSPS